MDMNAKTTATKPAGFPKTATQAKETYEKMSAATTEAADLIKSSYSTAVKGVQGYKNKFIEFARANTNEFARANTNAAFDFVQKLSGGKSRSALVELPTEHARKRRQLETLTALATAAMAMFLVARAQAGLNEIEPAEVKIFSTEFKYAPAMVWVTAARPVTLVLDNSGAETEHQFNLPAFGLRLMAEAGEITRKSVVFDKPGEYEFSCDLPGHREAGMKGRLIVSAP